MLAAGQLYNTAQTVTVHGFGYAGSAPTELPTWVLEHGYLIMFLINLVEGPIITATAAFGTALGYFNIYFVFLISFLANFLPDLMFYIVGLWGGQRILDKYGRYIGMTPDKRDEFAHWISGNAVMWLFVVKTMPLIGPPGIAIMGALRVPPVKQFIWWNVFIVALTSLFFCVIGYYSGKGYEALLTYTEYGIYGLAGVFLLFIIIAYLYRRAARKLSQKIEGLAGGEQMTNESSPDEPKGTDHINRPLRILIANDTYPPQLNGAAVTTQRLALGLASRGHQVAVIGPGTRFRDEVERQSVNGASGEATVFRLRSIPVRPIHPYFRMLYWVGVTVKVEKIVQDFQPDIIHIQNHFILGKACLKVARKNNIPIIGTNHFMPQNIFELIPGFLQSTLSSVMWKGFLKVYNRLDCVTVPSLAAQKMVEDLGLEARTRTISNGIDLEKYRKAAPEQEVFSKYNISRDRPTFLTVGRLEKDKNVDLIIKATDMAAKRAALQTVIVGKGRDEAEFRDLAQKLGLDSAVIFTGAVEDEELHALYNIADVYIGAGSAELQGIAVMEAMAMGLPVLAANAVALPELVRDGENGFLFSLDHNDLADQMVNILADRDALKGMGEKSLAYIQDHDMRKVLQQFEALYYEAIGSMQRELARKGS